MLEIVLSIVAPVLICASIGYGWARLGRPYDTELVTNLITTIGAPCLVFATLTKVEISMAAFSEMAGASFAAIVVFGIVAFIINKLAGLNQRAYLPVIMFANTGNMGVPLCLLAFGEAGLAFAVVVFTINAVAQFTIGVGISSGSASLMRLLRIPLLYAVAASLFFIISGVAVPEWIFKTADILGGMTIPVMLITLGFSLAKLHVGSFKRSLGMSIVRLAVGFAVGVGLAEVFSFEGAARGVLILDCAMPAAVFNYLFAQRYKTAPEEIAGVVVISTTLSFLTLPLLLWYVL